MKLSDHYTCPHIKGNPRMNAITCLGRWITGLDEGKFKPCRKCTILDERLVEMVRKRMRK